MFSEHPSLKFEYSNFTGCIEFLVNGDIVAVCFYDEEPTDPNSWALAGHNIGYDNFPSGVIEIKIASLYELSQFFHDCENM